MTTKLFRAAAGMLFAFLLFLCPFKALAQAPPPMITDFPSWEVASEFNDTANPSGVWTYCIKPTALAPACQLASASFSLPLSFTGWAAPTGSANGTIIHNTLPTAQMTQTSPFTVPPHALMLSPGQTGQYAVIRFTAPFMGTYKVCGQFYALDDSSGTGATTDVWLVRNKTITLYTAQIDYFNGAKFASFSCQTVALKVGNTLDFEVGWGADQNHFFDTTGLNAVIEKIR